MDEVIPVKPRFSFRQLFTPRLLVWLVLGALAYWAIKKIPFDEIWQSLHQVRPVQLLLWGGLNLLILEMVTGRWWLVLRSQGFSIPFFTLSGYRLAGFAVSYVTPGPQVGGEVLQAVLLQKHQSVPAASAVSSVVLEKVLELLSNFAFLGVGGLVIVTGGIFGAGGLQSRVIWFIAVVILLSIGYMLLLWRGHSPFSQAMRRVRFPGNVGPGWDRLVKFTRESEHQMGDFFHKSPLVLVQTLVLSFLIWAASVIDYALVASFLGLRLSIPEIIAALTVLCVAFLSPLPGGLGTLEAGQFFVMQSLGLNPALGISLSLLIRGRDIVLGGVGLFLTGWLYR